MKILVPDQKIAVFSTVVPMRWGDMDAYGHLNNATYLRLFEEARVQWLAASGHPLVTDNQGPVVANIFCNFYREINYPCQVRINLFVSEPGRTSNDCFMTMTDAEQPDVLYADGGAAMVWVDFGKKKPTALPQWYLALVDRAR